MLILNPRKVTFGPAVWDNVSLVAIDRAAEKVIAEWGDAGPHAVLADVPRQKVSITVQMDLLREDLAGPAPGDQQQLELVTTPTAADSTRRRLRTQAVVTAVRHEVSLKRGAVRVIELIAVSTAGNLDPITITDAGGAP